MVTFSHVTTLFGGAFTSSAGIFDLEVGAFGTGTFLFAGSRADGGLSSFRLQEGAAATIQDSVDYSSISGTLSVTDIDIVQLNGQFLIASAGAYDDRFALRRLDESGGFSGIETTGSPSVQTNWLTDTEVVSAAGTDYLITGRATQAGLNVYSIGNDYALTHVQHVADTAAAALADVSDMVSYKSGAETFVYTASSLEHGVSSFRVNPGGTLSHIDSFSDDKGLGVAHIQSLEIVETSSGRDYLLAGSAGTDSVAVVTLDADGSMDVVDLEMDTLHTRFRDVTALDSFRYSDRDFVLAGGSDGGLSMFEIGPDGSLYLHATLVDTTSTTLASVAAIETAVLGSEVQLFVSSSSEVGLTQFSIDLSGYGTPLAANYPTTDVTGTHYDDLVYGSAQRNVLEGREGDDRLIDGGGVDTLIGGPGADIFVLVEDGAYDRILDFQPGIDRIDLSSQRMLYSTDGLRFETTTYGARVTFRSEVLQVHSADGTPLNDSDFLESDFIF